MTIDTDDAIDFCLANSYEDLVPLLTEGKVQDGNGKWGLLQNKQLEDLLETYGFRGKVVKVRVDDVYNIKKILQQRDEEGTLEDSVKKLLALILRLPVTTKVLPEYFVNVVMNECPWLEIVQPLKSSVSSSSDNVSSSSDDSTNNVRDSSSRGGSSSNVWCPEIARDIEQTLYSRMKQKLKTLKEMYPKQPILELIRKAKQVNL